MTPPAKKTPEYDAKRRAFTRKYHHQAKAEAFNVLGRKCAHCGFTDERALQFDHVNGGGRQHLLSIGRDRRRFYKYVAAHPEEFQVLCANCNWIKRVENEETT